MNHIPKFICSENCQNPNYYYSGAPILSDPHDGVMSIEDSFDYKVEWQIWTDDQNIYEMLYT